VAGVRGCWGGQGRRHDIGSGRDHDGCWRGLARRRIGVRERSGGLETREFGVVFEVVLRPQTIAGVAGNRGP